MAEALVRNESPTEFFRELVESALQHQHVAARELTSFYVVNLLAGFVHLERRRPPVTTSRSACGSRRALQTAGIGAARRPAQGR